MYGTAGNTDTIIGNHLEENSFLSDFNIHEELFGAAHKSMKSHYTHREALVGTKRRKVT